MATSQTAEITDDEWDLFAAQLRAQQQAFRRFTDPAEPTDFAALVEQLVGTTPPRAARAAEADAAGDEAHGDDGRHEVEQIRQLEQMDYSELPPEDGEAIRHAGVAVAEALTQARNDVEAKAKELAGQTEPDFAQWAADMQKQRDEVKVKLDEKIDDAYTKLIEAGQKHPAARAGLKKKGFFLGVLVALASDLILKAFNWVIENLRKIVDVIVTGAKWVWHQLVNGAQAIAHFFGG
jgi:hypothetical protein